MNVRNELKTLSKSENPKKSVRNSQPVQITPNAIPPNRLDSYCWYKSLSELACDAGSDAIKFVF